MAERPAPRAPSGKTSGRAALSAARPSALSGYRVVARAPVEDDRAGDERDVEPSCPVLAPCEQLGRDSRHGLQPVERAAREADRVHVRIRVAGRPGRATADVGRAGRALREVEDGAAGRPFLVLRDADLEPGEVEGELRAVEARLRDEVGVVVREARHRRSLQSRCGRQGAHAESAVVRAREPRRRLGRRRRGATLAAPPRARSRDRTGRLRRGALLRGGTRARARCCFCAAPVRPGEAVLGRC